MEADQLQPPSSQLLWWAGALGATVALAVGEVFDRATSSTLSLVVAIGEWVIDLTPGDVVAGSINTIGTLQKPLLLAGITVIAIAIGGLVVSRSGGRASTILSIFTLFGIVGSLAGARSDLTSTGWSWASGLVAALIGAATAIGLAQLASRPSNASHTVVTPGTPLSQATDRRKFLAFGGAAAGSVALFAGSRVGRTGVADRARDELLSQSATTVPPAAGVGSTTSAPVTSTLPVSDFASIPGLTPRIVPISPKDEFYLIDTALQKPQVNLDSWTLTIDGYVDNETTFTYADLAAMDQIEREVTLSCVSNPVGGDLVGNAVWRGVLLTDLLEQAGVKDPTDMTTQIFSRSVDGWTCGFPTPFAYDGRTAMVALEMNGEPLPVIHGFPARLVIAGLYGYVSATKWVEQISITDWEGVDGFWMPRGWSKEGPIKTQSRIDVPQSNARISAGPTVLAGVAWSPTVGIEKVEVAIDSNDEWFEAELAEPASDETWVQWKLDWDATPGEHIAAVRATDKSGFTQSSVSVAPAPNGAEGYHLVQIRVDA